MPACRRSPLFRVCLPAALLALSACGSMATPSDASTPDSTAASGPRATDPAPASTPQAPASAPAAAVQALTLRPGGQAALEGGGTLRYLRLVNDSRCQPDVQCVWAGDAEIALAWAPTDGAPRTFSLHTGVEPRQQQLEDGRSVRLVELARGPAPAARLEISQAR
jgi:hypothetical protein